VIESAFVAIERTIQFRLIHDGAMSAAEVISSHRRLYQRGAEIGLYDDAFGDNLAELWNRNRTKTYYRLGIATRVDSRHSIADMGSLHSVRVCLRAVVDSPGEVPFRSQYTRYEGVCTQLPVDIRY